MKNFQQDVIGKIIRYADSYHLAYITSRRSAVIAERRAMKNVRGLGSVRFLLFRLRLLAITKLQNGDIFGIDIQGRLGSGGGKGNS